MIGNHVWRRDHLERARWSTYPVSGYTDPATARSLAVGVLYPSQWEMIQTHTFRPWLPGNFNAGLRADQLYIYDLQYVYPLYYGLATYPWRELLRDGEIIRAGTVYKDEHERLIREDAGPVSVRTIEDAAWTRIGEYLNRSFYMYGQWRQRLQGNDPDAIEVFRTLGEAGVYRWNREILDLYYAFWEWAGGARITNRVTRITYLYKEGLN